MDYNDVRAKLDVDQNGRVNLADVVAYAKGDAYKTLFIGLVAGLVLGFILGKVF